MAAPTVVRVQAGQVAAGTTVNTGTITGNTTGNGLFLAISLRLGPTTAGFGSVTDNIGHTWEQIGYVGIAGVTENSHLFWIPTTTGAVTQINWTNPSSVVSSWMLVEVSGHDTGPKSLALFKSSPDATVNTTMDLGAFTPPVNDCLVIAGYGTNDNVTASSVSDGFTLQATDDQSGASLQGYGIATKQLSGGEVCDPDFTMSGSCDGTGWMVAIAPSGAYASDSIANTRMGYRNGTTNGWLARPGFAYGGNDYLCLAGTDNKLHMYRSTNLGVTWTELDSANAPAHSDDQDSYNGRLPISGSGITDFYYAIRRPSTNTLRVRRFDLVNGVWEANDIGSADACTDAASTHTCDIVVRSDGDVVVGYRDNAGDDVSYTRYEGVSWSGPVDVHSGGSVILQSMVRGVNSSDTIHFFFIEEAADDLTHRSLSNANVLSATTDLDATIAAAELFAFQAGYYNDAGTDRFAWLRNDTGAPGDTTEQHATAPPTNTGTAFQPVATSGARLMSNMGGGIVYHASRVNGVYSVSGTGKIAWFESDDISTPAYNSNQIAHLVVKGLSNSDVPCSPYASADGLAVAYSDGTDTRIAWVYNNTVPPAGGATTVTPGTATATGAANAPTVKITITPGTATANGQADAPTVVIRVTPGTATATGVANEPIRIGENLTRVTPGTATATGAANEPVVRIVVTPGTATASGQANSPTLFITLNPGTATATGVANAPVVKITATPGTATATGQANEPTVAVTLKPGAATATGAANAPVVKITVTPGTATASGLANEPTLRVVIKPGTATATGAAGEPAVVIQLAPSTFISGAPFMAYALSGDALEPVAVVLIEGSPLMEHAVGGGEFIVSGWGGASYTTASLAGAAIVESD